MEKQQWKYKISGSILSVVLSFIMLAGFGSLAIWFHLNGNGAIIIGRIIVIFAAVAFILALYRAVFFKVLIGREGFFYQSAPGNGRYYRYSEINNAWLSSGKETNSTESVYCNYETMDGNTVRFFITGADTDAADYFIKRVDSSWVDRVDRNNEDKKTLVINGKAQGLQNILVIGFVLFILFVLTNSLGLYKIFPVLYIFTFGVPIVSAVYVIVQYYFYLVEIQKDGFYCRTNPFNGQYYPYRDIVDCGVIEKRKKFGSVRDPGVRRTHYFYFFIFTDKSGKERKILFNKALFEREIEVLVSRIEQR